MAQLVEFKVSKTLFDDVKNDLEFRMGFEAEFHVKYASDLLKDQYGNMPDDFQSFTGFSGGDVYQGAFADYGNNNQEFDQETLDYHRETVLDRLCRLFERYLGLPQGGMIITSPHSSNGIDSYQKWQLTIDESLSLKGGNENADEDLGVELISPVMPLREGLAWMNKVFEMIKSFQNTDTTLYTSNRCGFHVNLSHIRMGTSFDYAKLAILSGDQYYLQDFQRLSNAYAAPIMQAVKAELTRQQANPNALNLLNMRGWSPQRVMNDMAKMIPMDHHMSIDLSRWDSNNPYIEVRIAGNAGYENRFDDIAKMAIRFGALIKIACDPNANREEYLRKIYQLISTTISQPVQQQNIIPKVWAYLNPILTPQARTAVNQIAQFTQAGTPVQNAPFLVLAIIRAAIDTRATQNLRIHQGLLMLIQDVLKIQPADLLKALKNPAMLTQTGVLRFGEKNPNMLPALTNYVKWLAQPVKKIPMMNSAQPPEEEDEPKKKKKPQLSEYEKRRLKEKFEKMDGAARERKLRRELLSEQNKRPHKTPVRWIA